MWPLVEVQTTFQAWGYFFIAFGVIVMGPILLAVLLNVGWWRKHFDRKIEGIEKELGKKVGI